MKTVKHQNTLINNQEREESMGALRIIGNASNTTEPTTYRLARQAVRLYPRTHYTDRKAVTALRAGWIKAIQYLGEKWLLHPSNSISRRSLGFITPDAAVFYAVVALSVIALCMEAPA